MTGSIIQTYNNYTTGAHRYWNKRTTRNIIINIIIISNMTNMRLDNFSNNMENMLIRNHLFSLELIRRELTGNNHHTILNKCLLVLLASEKENEKRSEE